MDLPAQQGPEAMLAEMAPFLFRDPPDHTRLRGLVQKAFTPRVVEGLRPRLEEICDGLLDDALERGEVDLVADYAYPLPVQIIVEMLGVPAEDHEQFRVWSHALARGLDPDFLLPPEAVQQRLGAILSFVQYFASLIEERRQKPGDDLLTRLIQAEEQGDVLTQGELLSTCILLLVAGHETTVNLISGGALALMERPDQLALVRDDPERHPQRAWRRCCASCARSSSPDAWRSRTWRSAGRTSPKGEFSMLLIGSANRDPAAFEDPDTFDVTRTDNNHLGFGFGIHHCLGAPLARLEAQIALPDAVPAGPAPRAPRPTPSPTRRTSCCRGLEAPSRPRCPPERARAPRSDGRPGGDERPRSLALGHQGEVEEELLLVMPADDLHAHGKAVDGTDRDRDGRVAGEVGREGEVALVGTHPHDVAESSP